MRWEAERQIVADTARTMLHQGLVTATAGNVSLYLDKHDGTPLIAITPSARPYEGMRAQDVVVIDFDVDVIDGDGVPSSESLTHVAIYKARPDVRCVIHTHSVYASVLAVAAIELPPIIDELVAYLGGPVKVAEYGFPSTLELGEKAAAALEDRNAVFLRNHGAVGVGRTADEALRNCLLLERAAQVFIYASLVGKANVLPDDVIEAERSIFKMSQGRDVASGSLY